jgi:hypothetical protein
MGSLGGCDNAWLGVLGKSCIFWLVYIPMGSYPYSACALQTLGGVLGVEDVIFSHPVLSSPVLTSSVELVVAHA